MLTLVIDCPAREWSLLTSFNTSLLKKNFGRDFRYRITHVENYISRSPFEFLFPSHRGSGRNECRLSKPTRNSPPSTRLQRSWKWTAWNKKSIFNVQSRSMFPCCEILREGGFWKLNKWNLSFAVQLLSLQSASIVYFAIKPSTNVETESLCVEILLLSSNEIPCRVCQ